jgi:WD40 repeat protein
MARSLGIAWWLLVLAGVAPGQAPAPAPPGGGAPVLRVEAGGPTAFVTALAFSPDGKTLYAGGYDKVVRVWALDPDKGFVPSSASYRVPIGAGPDGVINAVAVSADGTWLATAGVGAKRGAGSFREVGWVVPRTGMTPEMRQDEGTIYAFNTRTGAVRTLRGHKGPVLSLAFDPVAREGGPFLASAALERDAGGGARSTAVRLWDLGRGSGKEEVFAYPGLPDPIHPNGRVTRPGLAPFVGGQDGRPRVAIAADDRETPGDLRIGEPGGTLRLGQKPDGRFNTTAVYWPEQGQLLTASVYGTRGYLQAWSADLGSRPARDGYPWADLGEGEVPRALALFARGGSDYAAVVTRAPNRRNEVSLHLIDLHTFQAAAAPVALWKDTDDDPALAVAPKGRHLAVAGDAGHTIRVFAIDDLLGGKAKPLPPLQSQGTTLRYVGFVTADKARGLLLNERPEGRGKPPRKPAQGDLVFDLERGTMTTEWKKWKSDAPADVGAWEVDEGTMTADGRVLRVKHNGERAGEVALQPGQELTAYALLPASPAPLRVPLLAVAFIEGGETVLTLYRIPSGEPVRQCTGPVNPIQSLAFSGDGRLLAAAAADQTVCVWSLTNLPEIVGQHGLLRGLFVKDDDKGRPVVARLGAKLLTPDNRRRLEEKGVRPNDAVEGLVVDGKLSPTASARDFYRAAWEIAPTKQKTVTVRINGKDVALDVSQGADDRKPLLSLFVTAADRKTGRREWIGWSPVGPYDSSSREAERLVGWHVNTGETAKPPVRFALADQFRKDNYKPGILKKLIDYGNPGQAIEAWKPPEEDPPPDPAMSFGIEEDGLTVPAARPGHFRVGQRQVTLTVALDGFPADKVGAVEWRALGERGQLRAAGENKWSADLSHLPWKRGEWPVKVLLRTAAPHAREYPGELSVRYQPPAPKLEELRAHAGATDRDPYPVALRVTPGKGQTVRITVRQKGKNEPVLNEKDVREARDIRKDVGLAAGENLIQVVAENVDTAEGPAGEAERVRLDLPVTYKVPRPQIALKHLAFPDGSERRIDPDGADTPLVVDVPTFRVVGEMEALADLVGAEWAAGDGKAEPLAGFVAAKNPRRVAVDQPITLTEPGVRRLRFLARVAKGEKAEERYLTIEYRPRLPSPTVTAPANGQSFYAGKDPLKVTVEVALRWPQDPRDCQARLLVNGKEQGEPLPVRAGEKTFQGEAPLRPGENTIEVRLTNQWQKEPAVAGPAVVYYRRPARVAKMSAGKPTDKPPQVEITAAIESADDLPLERAELSVAPERSDGLRVTGDATKRVVVPASEMTSEKGERGKVWTVRAKVPLDEGNNVVSLAAFNKDGPSLKPAATTVPYMKPPPPRPEVHFFAPRDDASVESADYEVHFIVRSETPLTKVELVRGGDEPLFKATPDALKKAKREGQLYVYEVRSRVTLKRGDNRLRAVTANEEGGEASTSYVTVNYHYRPVVRIRIDALEVKGRVILPAGEPSAGGALPFARVATGRVKLWGHISWDREHDAALAAVRQVEVSVNGYHQLPALLDPAPAGERSRAFKVDILLSRENNTVEVLRPRGDPEFADAADSRRRCEVACEAPVPVRQQLFHLLAIDLDDDIKKATDDALAAVGGRDLNRKAFAVPYCSDGGQLYGPLAGDDVTPEAVNYQLDLIQQALQGRARAGAVNDIVMVYYRGGVVTKDGAQFFHTSLSRRARDPRPPTLLSCDRLARFFGEALGAQLVFLDVAESSDSSAKRDRGTDLVASRSEPHVAVMRYTWNGEPGKQPTEALILTDLRDAMTGARAFGDIRKKVAARFYSEPADKQPWRSKRSDKSWYDDRVPPEMGPLPLGAASRSP